MSSILITRTKPNKPCKVSIICIECWYMFDKPSFKFAEAWFSCLRVFLNASTVCAYVMLLIYVCVKNNNDGFFTMFRVQEQRISLDTDDHHAGDFNDRCAWTFHRKIRQGWNYEDVKQTSNFTWLFVTSKLDVGLASS